MCERFRNEATERIFHVKQNNWKPTKGDTNGETQKNFHISIRHESNLCAFAKKKIKMEIEWVSKLVTSCAEYFFLYNEILWNFCPTSQFPLLGKCQTTFLESSKVRDGFHVWYEFFIMRTKKYCERKANCQFFMKSKNKKVKSLGGVKMRKRETRKSIFYFSFHSTHFQEFQSSHMRLVLKASNTLSKSWWYHFQYLVKNEVTWHCWKFSLWFFIQWSFMSAHRLFTGNLYPF